MVGAAFVLLLAMVIQTISAQIVGPYGPGFAGPALAAEALAYGPPGPLGPGLPGPLGPGLPGPLGPGLPGPLSPCGIPATSGGGFMITSVSPISPTGISVQTDRMAIEGPLAVSGQLPFLGVVALEGPLPVAGQGAVAYGCGTGNVGILNEVTPPPLAPMNPYGYNGYPNGYGCGPYY